MRYFYASLLAVSLSFISVISAHPVIWKGGNVAMIQSDFMSSSAIVHHSLSQAWSLGARAQIFHENEDPFLIGQSNWLVQRWNGQDSQGNFYLLSGLGVSTKKDLNQSLLHFGVQADWETRRIYTYSKLDYYQTDIGTLAFRGRLGVAPYRADFEEIHTWLIAQLDYVNRDGVERLSLIPVIRLFQDNILVEFGSDFSGHTLVTAMLHF